MSTAHPGLGRAEQGGQLIIQQRAVGGDVVRAMASSRSSGSSPSRSGTQVPWPEYVMTTASPAPARESRSAILVRIAAPDAALSSRVRMLKPRGVSAEVQSAASLRQPYRSFETPGSR